MSGRSRRASTGRPVADGEEALLGETAAPVRLSGVQGREQHIGDPPPPLSRGADLFAGGYFTALVQHRPQDALGVTFHPAKEGGHRNRFPGHSDHPTQRFSEIPDR